MPDDVTTNTPDDSADPGLPALHSWGALYAFVTFVFIAYVLVLAWLSRAFLP